MKKVWSILLVMVMCCGMLVGCGENNKFSLNKPYLIQTDNFECEIKVTGATRTNMLDDWVEESKTSDIVMLELDIKPTKVDTNDFSSYDVWNNIRVCDEDGEEIVAFNWALPGDTTSIVMINKDETKHCTIPYQMLKNSRYMEVDIYQNTEYSNKVKINIE